VLGSFFVPGCLFDKKIPRGVNQSMSLFMFIFKHGDIKTYQKDNVNSKYQNDMK